MENLTNAVIISLDTKNYYSALALALSLPDIAGRIESPTDGSQKRYIHWFDKYVKPKYTIDMGGDTGYHVFLTGNDCYALRCSLLHEGNAEIEQQRARKIITNFLFLSNSTNHCNEINNALQLDVSTFCYDIVNSVKDWVADISGDKDKTDQLSDILVIKDGSKGFGF